MDESRPNLIVELSLSFAVLTMEFAQALATDRKYVFSDQILRCGTAIGAHVMEAQSAESRADFIHKMKVADKEARETAYWLSLCRVSPIYPNPPAGMEESLASIRRVLSKILGTSRRNEPAR